MSPTSTLDPGSLVSIATTLTAVLALKLAPRPAARVHGGCINESFRWESSGGPLFVKLGEAANLAMFQGEAEGLEELARAAAVRVPRVLAVGEAADRAYLALEWIGFAATSPASETRLGESLAGQHRIVGRAFGWYRDNTIGSTPQSNAWMEDWAGFFRERRLRYQLELARSKGYEGRLQERGARLLERMDAFFVSYKPSPSLLHGDLWSGNWGMAAGGAPVIFDPAVYYGDREADIAMTRLFGGFSAGFYTAYESAWPLDKGGDARVALYNLYHLLNHLNLFGSTYLRQAQSTIDRLLAEVGH